LHGEVAPRIRVILLLEGWDATKHTCACSLLSGGATIAAASHVDESVADKRLGSSDMYVQLASEIALIRQTLSLPATYEEYDADTLLTYGKSDKTNTEFHALVNMGVRFPWAGETEQQLALFNPYETAVQNFSGFILPAHAVVARLATTGQAGSLLLSQYQYQTSTARELTRCRIKTEYSPTWQYCTNGANAGAVAAATIVEDVFEGSVPAGVTLGESTWTEQTEVAGTRHGENNQYAWYYTKSVWRWVWLENYTVIDTVEHSITGAVNAQTILNSQNGWLRKIGLKFTAKAADGAVNLLLTDTINGLPNMQRVLGKAVVSATDIKVDGNETLFEFPQPLYLSAGTRYAIVLITGGAHSVALVEGTKYSQGTLFYSTDGEYFQGDFTKDLMMTLYYAQFSNPRTVVELGTVSLAEGIAAFSLLTEAIIPDATSLVLEYQPSGSGDWIPLTDGTTDSLLGLPAMCRLRVVFNGSVDIMPGLGLSGSKLRAQRPGTSFKHISTQRTLGQASASIHVTLRLENWVAAKHACSVKLLSGGTTYEGTVEDEAIDATTIRRTVKFTPNTPTGITQYQIVIEGTTTTPLVCFHVAERMDVAL